VLKLAPGSYTQTVLPFTTLHDPAGIAVDSAGNVYITDRGTKQVLRLAPDSSAQTALSFTELSAPAGLTVDNAGNVYVGDGDGPNAQVLKLWTQ
jgi:serine/threonine protein kinase, bacterial